MLLTPRGFSVTLRYCERDAKLVVTSEGITTSYEEEECDNLLRVIECSADPVEDLAEFFSGDFPRTGYRVAVQFHDHARQIADLVYA